MKISIITLFPNMFPPVLNASILGRAQKKGFLEVEYINLRQFGEGVHQVVDDKSYGGGVGLVLKPDILAKAWQSIPKEENSYKTLLLSASGTPFQ